MCYMLNIFETFIDIPTRKCAHIIMAQLDEFPQTGHVHATNPQITEVFSHVPTMATALLTSSSTDWVCILLY